MGQLIKIIIITIGVSVVLLVIRQWLGRRRKTEEPHTAAIQPMVQCAYCGMYTPESQAISEGEQFYCNEAHRQIGVDKKQ